MRLLQSLLFIGLLFDARIAYCNVWYCATNGLPGNLGTLVSPWDLRTALNKTSLISGGDTLYLRGGSYTNAPENSAPAPTCREGDIFSVTISGSYTNPVLITSYPGEHAALDGLDWTNALYSCNATVRPILIIGNSINTTIGRFLTWKNIEVMSSSNEKRVSSDDTSSPADLTRPDGIYVYGQSNIFINVVVHDLSSGFLVWEQSSRTVMQDCLAYNNGWQGSVHAHGHGMYTQNLLSRETKIVGTNIFCNNSDNSLQAYGASTQLYHYRIGGNIFLNNRLLLGGQNNTVEGDFIVDRNYLYNADLVYIYHASTNAVDMTLINNYVAGGFSRLQGGSWQTCLITNNTVIDTGDAVVFDLVPISGLTVPSGWTVNNNHYVMSNTNLLAFNIEGALAKKWTNWVAFTGGWDSNSPPQAPLPTTNLVTLMPITSDPDRAHIAVYNWASNSTVPISLSALGWSSSDSVRVRNAQDYYADVKTNTIPGLVLTLPMLASAHTLALPHGSSIPFGGPMSFPTFGAFVIERIAGAPPTPTNTITITSTPATGVSIVATSDNNGNGTGTTTFARNYLFGASVTLVAPATSGTNNFSQWLRAGAPFTSSTTANFTVSTNETWTAVYVAPPAVTWTFNMASLNPSNASLTNSPLDNSGLGGGVAPYSRVYNDGTVVTLTAPAMSGTNMFHQWLKAGLPFSTSQQLTITANSAGLSSNPTTFTAEFEKVSSPTNSLVVASINPGSGVLITVSPADVNGLSNGTTLFNRTYHTNDTVTLTAPYTSPIGTVWLGWQDEMGIISSTNLGTTFMMDTNRTRTAAYTNAPLAPVTQYGHASNRRRGVR